MKSTRHRLPRGASFRLAVVCALALGGCAGEPDRYESLADLTRRQEERGFVVVATFGGAWPAKVVDVRTAPEEISFTLADGTPHGYQGFDGYEMKLVRLEGEGDGKETVVVLRSEEKR